MTFFNFTVPLRSSHSVLCVRRRKQNNAKLLGVGFERVFIFSVTLDTRKNERQMSVSTIETTKLREKTFIEMSKCNGKQRMIHSQP
jgi:hypothetical protein